VLAATIDAPFRSNSVSSVASAWSSVGHTNDEVARVEEQHEPPAAELRERERLRLDRAAHVRIREEFGRGTADSDGGEALDLLRIHPVSLRTTPGRLERL
jgi:hypothetical protein